MLLRVSVGRELDNWPAKSRFAYKCTAGQRQSLASICWLVVSWTLVSSNAATPILLQAIWTSPGLYSYWQVNVQRSSLSLHLIKQHKKIKNEWGRDHSQNSHFFPSPVLMSIACPAGWTNRRKSTAWCCTSVTTASRPGHRHAYAKQTVYW